jgi:ABC-type uncharacterized transport system involved in gliding motility auxiliary subunit
MGKQIANIIGWLGTLLVAAALVIRFGFPAQEQYAYYLAWAGLGSMLLYMLTQWREIADAFARRQTRYGTLSLVGVLTVLGILVAVNYIGKRQNKRWDLTDAKQYSLSDQTRNVLTKLDAPLQIDVFAQEIDFQRFRDRLREYEYTSKQVSTQYIDPDKQRTIAQQNDIQQYGTVIFRYKGRTERVTQDTEQDLTNGIIKVVSGEQKKIYFTQGHGEKDPTSTDRDGYGTIADALKKENYGVEKLVLAQTGSVPDDASAVVVAGPRTDLFPQEIEALEAFVAKNGKLLLMLDPPSKPDDPQPTGLVALAKAWGIEVGNTIVVDASGMGRLIGTDASVPVVASYPPHPITDRFNVITAYPLARSVVAVPGGANGRTAQSFIESSDRSWAEADLAGLMTKGEVSLDEAKGDKAGPVSLGAAVSVAAAPDTKPEDTKPEDAKAADKDAPKPETRVVVVGDSDFASNGVLGIQGNRDLFMNIVGWLSQQESLISIRPRQASDRRLTLTATQQSNVIWMSLLILPGVIFGTGVLTWWRRR